ncbi:uncharacterized protein LOC115322951 [Ixodes scapularis]|uniref:uncharacterized protein LOC115322951 n=1 Tax=Ixodes scapularis TaxID=6945 RepID=UPI001C38F81C|nr:uncharacterized protein LOC115322951 [Ixodes scapularis]
MSVLFGMLVLASLIFCLDAERMPNGPNKKGSSRRETKITIAYLLDGNSFSTEAAARNSTAGHWLNSVQEKAQQKINKELQVNIKFDITNINITDSDLTQKLIHWCSNKLINASAYLDYLKQSYQNKVSPDMICVLTNYTMYDEDLDSYLAYIKHKTLCESMVPFLLTYIPNKVNNTGEFLSELIKKSITSKKVKLEQSDFR